MNRPAPHQQPVDFDLDPLDDPDPFDPTGYYARQTKHREEMLPLLAWLWGIGLVIVAGAVIWNLVMD